MLFSARDRRDRRGLPRRPRPVPLVVDPVMVASSGRAAAARRTRSRRSSARLFPLATVVTPNLREAEALAGGAGSAPRAGRAAASPAAAGGDRHGRPRPTSRSTPLRRRAARRDPGPPPRRRRDARRRLHALGDARRAARPRRLARGGRAAAAAVASEAVRHGLAGARRGDGPVDVLHWGVRLADVGRVRPPGRARAARARRSGSRDDAAQLAGGSSSRRTRSSRASTSCSTGSPGATSAFAPPPST